MKCAFKLIAVIVGLLLFSGTALAQNNTSKAVGNYNQARKTVKGQKLNESIWKRKLEQLRQKTQGQEPVGIIAVGGSATEDRASTGVVIGNADETRMAEDIAVKITIRDESGTVVGTQEEKLVRIPADSVAFVGGITDTTAPAEDFEVEIQPPKNMTEQGDTPYFEEKNVELDPESLEITGKIKNPFKTKFRRLRIYAVYATTSEVQAEPQITGGAFVDVKNVGPRKTVPFTITPDIKFEATDAGVYANPIGQRIR